MTRERTVRVMKLVRVDRDGAPHDEAGDFWPHLLDALASTVPDPWYDHWHNAHNYRGVAYPELPLLYVAKNRSRADAPSEWTPAGTAAPLDREIHEPLFIHPIADTPAVAVLGTSGAASPTAVGRWVTAFASLRDGESFELHPVFLGNVRAQIEAAIGATTLEVGMRVDDLPPGSTGRVERALAMATEGSGDMEIVKIRMSMGRGNHGPGSAALLGDGRRIIESPALTSGKMTVRIRDAEGNLRSELLNLVSHRFTHKVRTAGDDVSLSIETAMPALQDCITEFTKTAEYAALKRESAVD